jgi:transposase
MRGLVWLTGERMAPLEPFVPESHGLFRVDDRRVVSGLIVVNRNGLRWRRAPAEPGPLQTRLATAGGAGAGWGCLPA